MIKIVTILGTKRPGNYTAKALALVQDEIRKNPEIELIQIEKRIRSLANNLIDYIHNNICPRFTLEEMVRENNL